MAKKDNNKPQKVKEKKGKEKTPKNKKGAAVPPSATSTPGGAPANGAPQAGAAASLANLSPEQMTAAQLEQAIKEGSDPNAKLKKLRSPLNVRSCLINVLILIVATFAIVVLWCFLAVDKFNFATVMSDMFEKFHITSFFQNMGSTISGWFS